MKIDSQDILDAGDIEYGDGKTYVVLRKHNDLLPGDRVIIESEESIRRVSDDTEHEFRDEYDQYVLLIEDSPVDNIERILQDALERIKAAL